MKYHKLIRLLESLHNKPHLITPDGLDSVMGYLNHRNISEELSILSRENSRHDARDKVSVENGVAVLSVNGNLVSNYDFISSLCGIRSYDSLLSDTEEAIKQGVHTLVFDVDSSGGEAHKCFETMNDIRKLCDDHGVKIISYVDGKAASAAMATVAISDEIIANPMSSLGSVGVVISLKNSLPKEINEGTEVVFVYSGDSKIPFKEDGTFKAEFLEGLQEESDELYVKFVEHIARYRPMTEDQVISTGAKMFRAEKAVELGLADKVMTVTEFMEYLADISEGKDLNKNKGGSMPIFGRKDAKLSTPSDASEDINLEGSDPSVTNLEEEGQEEMTENVVVEELQRQLAEAQAQAEKAMLLQTELEGIKSKVTAEKLAKLTAEMSEYSFINEDNAALLASFVMENEGSDTVSAVMSSLDAAKEAVEAGLDNQIGDEGEPQPDSQLAAEQAAQKKVAANRYTK